MKNKKQNRKCYYYTTDWEYIPKFNNEVKVYYDKPNETVYLKKLLQKLKPNDSVLLDSISSIAPSWDVLIKTLQTFNHMSIDLCLGFGYKYVCPLALLSCVADAIANGTCLHYLTIIMEHLISNQIEELGAELYD